MAYSIMHGNIVLLFGVWSLSKCSTKTDIVYSSILEKRLINNVSSNNNGDDEHIILFDPETLKIKVKNNFIISKEQLAVELDLEDTQPNVIK